MDMPVIMCDYDATPEEKERLQARHRISEMGCYEIWARSPTPPIRDPDDFTSEEEEKPMIERNAKNDFRKAKKKSKKSSKKSSRKRKKGLEDEILDFDPDDTEA